MSPFTGESILGVGKDLALDPDGDSITAGGWKMTSKTSALLASALILSALFSCLQPASPVAKNNASTSSFKVSTVVSRLQVPWEVAFAPDGRIFISERPGRMRIVKDGQLLDDAWMTLNVHAEGEGGLLGFDLDPQFSQNGFIYAAYTYSNQSNEVKNRLVRLKEDATGKGVLDRILVDGVGAAIYHNGGRVKYGPDGKVYWTMGENFQRDLAQDLKSLNGKILRVNPDGTVPADNPFLGSYIYSYGHRNPQGLAWQPGTGRLYETEHGPSGEWKGSAQDEVNYIVPGGNYGWPVIAGDETSPGMISPVIQSGTNETWAPSGATFVTSGAWSGSLLFAGLRGQTLYRLILDSNNPYKALSLERYLSGQYGRLRDVVQGPDGAIYLLTNNTDGRSTPSADDDKLLRLTLQ